MSKAVDQLPAHLKQYIDQQNYGNYTSRDHAVWRYILKQNLSYFANREFAVPEYAKGLHLTGIPLNEIPRISDMDASLDKFGWGAVPVCGFIPPVAFLEFQSFGVLPIAHNMRSLEHIGYTPAPDIVHESAGHAPILVNEIYADYLKRYARVAGKAISSKKYFQQYEAIRKLSDLKELSGVDPSEIEKAEYDLLQLKDGSNDVSESAQVIRLYWWTAEYGLFGEMNNPKVFGAGLLSSVDESQNCLSSRVKKIPFSIECIQYSYDITQAQPQLFVVRKFEDLLSTLEEMEKLLAYQVGGNYGLQKALEAETVVTIQWQNGAFYSGIVKRLLEHNEKVKIITLNGPCQIGFKKELLVGLIGDAKSQMVIPFGIPQKMMVNQILKKNHEFKPGDQIFLDYGNQFTIEGRLLECKGSGSEIGMLKIENSLICLKGEQIRYATFFVPLGNSISSVSGGPFQQDFFKEYDVGKASTKPIQDRQHSEKTKVLFELYEKVHHWKSHLQAGEFKRLCNFTDSIFEKYSNEWLLWLEVFEMLKRNKNGNAEISEMLRELQDRINMAKNNLSNSEVAFLDKGLIYLNNM